MHFGRQPGALAGRQVVEAEFDCHFGTKQQASSTFRGVFHQERIDYPGALQAPALLAPSGASCLSVEIGQAHDQDCDQGAQ